MGVEQFARTDMHRRAVHAGFGLTVTGHMLERRDHMTFANVYPVATLQTMHHGRAHPAIQP